MKGKNRSDQEGILEPDGWIEIQDVFICSSKVIACEGFSHFLIVPFYLALNLSEALSIGLHFFSTVRFPSHRLMFKLLFSLSALWRD